MMIYIIGHQFTDRYKTLSNADLLKIIDNPGDHKAHEIEAANTEFAARSPDEFGPASKATPTTNKIIAVISVVFSISFLSLAYRLFESISLATNDNNLSWGLINIYHLVSLCTLAAGVFMFWQRKKWGWVLLCAYFAYTVSISAASSLIWLKLPGIGNALLPVFLLPYPPFTSLT